MFHRWIQRRLRGKGVCISYIRSLGGATSILEGSYSGDTHHKSTQATWSTTAGNGNIATIRWPFYCACFQIGYSPAIPKTSAKTLLLNQRISWARR